MMNWRVNELPAHWFERDDNSPDEEFYAQPRMVAHIDDATIVALTEFYREFIPANADIVDLMSSWISHLPTEASFGRVAGLGMNAQELTCNEQLTQWCVHNLNAQPILPYESASFDIATLAVSVQYLTRPQEVMTSVREVLRDGGKICIAMSHRLFPTKAVAAFRQMSAQDRVGLVTHYLEHSGFTEVEFIDRSPVAADPLWLVVGTA